MPEGTDTAPQVPSASGDTSPRLPGVDSDSGTVEVRDGMLYDLSRIISLKLKTRIRVMRSKIGNGYQYSVVFDEFRPVNGIVNRDMMHVDKVKRFLALLIDMVDFGVIGPGPR